MIRLFGILAAVFLAGSATAQTTEKLIVAGGCFWCVEADFEKVSGVVGAVSGFAGGKTSNPTYKDVTRGRTGHLEAVEIEFDPTVVSRTTLLNMFVRSIDLTDAGGQFCDRGASYATAIFVRNAEQEKGAKAVLKQAQSDIGAPVVTRVLQETPFWPAGAEHQDYYKSSDRVVTRFGIKTKADAYKLYRNACGRDARVLEIWGSDAPFAGRKPNG